MSHALTSTPLTAREFAPFGDVIEVSGAPDMLINQGMCARHHDLARLDFADGRAGISVFDAKARTFPHVVDMVERHPEGSQAWQSVNLHRGVWHGVLIPIREAGQYVVVDRIGEGDNLQVHWFETPYVVE
jgi:ureidoglycolate lyase